MQDKATWNNNQDILGGSTAEASKDAKETATLRNDLEGGLKNQGHKAEVNRYRRFGNVVCTICCLRNHSTEECMHRPS
jgi:hypothetical protein